MVKMIVSRNILGIFFAVCISGTIGMKEPDFPALDHIRPSASADTQTQAAQNLIHRLVPSHASSFKVSVDSSIGPKNKDTFKIANGASGHIQITGTTGVGVAIGFYYYLKKYCNSHISWAGDQVTLPDKLPSVPDEGITISTNDRFRYYQNVCTVSYSFVWWNWTRWEKEIDWMAMNGINFPLAFNGQEGIWNRVYLAMGFTQDELDAHFAGPAFLAWQRMGNMEGWGGPLTMNWHNQQMALQHLILERMRSLGIIPILPAFAGHVPKAITRVFPKANVSSLGNWGGFDKSECCTTFLEPTDPLFQQIGKAFITEYISEFGTDHVYNCDSFNEMTPRSSDPAYLKGAGQGVFNGMLEGDSQAVWVMQGWLFLSGFWKPPQAQALLTSVPIGKMIILDLDSDESAQYTRLESYYGQPFIWNMLHDFGGTMAMYGDIDRINTGPFSGRNFTNSTMIGIGLTPEGINQNDVIYEFMMENTWRKQPENLTAWFNNYPTRRYGVQNSDTQQAWQSLLHSVYNGTHAGGEQDETIIVRTPTMAMKPNIWYDPKQVFDAWDHFTKAAEQITESDLFRYDLVDVNRQSLQIISTMVYHNMIEAIKSKNMSAFLKTAEQMTTLLSDLDTLLQTDVHYLLGRWIADAKAWGMTPAEIAQYELNARNQVTMWGPNGQILDYANKQWAGLVKGYYLPRWQLFIQRVQESLASGKAFDQNAYNAEVRTKVEKPFTYAKDIYTPKPLGDQILASKLIHTKYRPLTLANKEFFTSMFEDSKLYSHKIQQSAGISYLMGREPSSLDNGPTSFLEKMRRLKNKFHKKENSIL